MSSTSSNTKTVLIVGIPLLVIVVLLIFFGDAQSPKQVSLDRLSNLEQAVISFIETNGKAPASLSELGLPQEQLEDHLGEPFIYTLDEHSITLLSYGSDKKPGGKFFKSDYSVTIDLPKSK